MSERPSMFLFPDNAQVSAKSCFSQADHALQATHAMRGMHPLPIISSLPLPRMIPLFPSYFSTLSNPRPISCSPTALVVRSFPSAASAVWHCLPVSHQHAPSFICKCISRPSPVPLNFSPLLPLFILQLWHCSIYSIVKVHLEQQCHSIESQTLSKNTPRINTVTVGGKLFGWKRGLSG